jgi:ABC-2 type transport system permease protein
MNHIRTIIDKEWAEVFKNKIVLFTIIIMPLLFTALPLIMLSVTAGSAIPGGDTADVPDLFLALCGPMDPTACMQIFMVNQFLILYMMLPLIIPITIAAYSIVGEKTTRSLEPLLATPISTENLLLGKALAAALPAISATWICFFIFQLLIPITGASEAVRAYVLGPTWLLGVLVVGPLMAVAAVSFAIMISSRVNDPRIAEQLAAVLIIPVMGIMFGQIAGLLVVNLQLMLTVIAIMLIVDILLIYLGARLFQRETILTRWK